MDKEKEEGRRSRGEDTERLWGRECRRRRGREEEREEKKKKKEIKIKKTTTVIGRRNETRPCKKTSLHTSLKIAWCYVDDNPTGL